MINNKRTPEELLSEEQRKLEDIKKREAQLKNKIKQRERKIAAAQRKKRDHWIYTTGGDVVSFIENAEQYSNARLREILRVALHDFERNYPAQIKLKCTKTPNSALL